WVLVRQNAVHELNEGYVHAVVAQNIGEFHADGAATDNDHLLRGHRVEDLLLVGNHVLGELHTREGVDHGTGGDDAVIEGDGLAGVLAVGYLDGLGVLEGAEAVDLGDLV